MFEHFEKRRITTLGAGIHTLVGGAGPPLLLLHGYPQTHVMWHAVAARLRTRFTLVIPDLRGYGDSAGPEPDPQHAGYSKRAMAADLLEVMSALDHRQFAVAGHDRGAAVAHRLALEHPQRVTRLAVLDTLPTLDTWEQLRSPAALRRCPWLLLTQPRPLPERLIGADPEFFVRHVLHEGAVRRDAFTPAATAAYVNAFAQPAVIAAACEDHRAAATVDLDHDRADLAAGRRIRCPVLLLWSTRHAGLDLAAAGAIWRRWAAGEVAELAFGCGHFIAEEEPDLCAAALEDFFAEPIG